MIAYSRRRAVIIAWLNERKLVLKGMGTRDWTRAQQKDIIEKKKAFDENGYAFEGHHMKNVKTFSKLAGDPHNIRFLTRREHLDAHKGNWRNTTNGLYNPVSKFCEEGIEAQQIIALSDPLYINRELLPER